MKNNRLPDFFWVGPQKAASSWGYVCFKEHPEIYVHEKEDRSGVGADSLHYYNIHYNCGLSWYNKFFEEATKDQIIGDTTPSYIRSPFAPKRIYEDNSEAKIIMCLRNPIERAYSHYWHEKKKDKINFEFEEVFENYDLFQNWIEPGFYTEYIKRYEKYFDEEQILILIMDDLVENPRKFVEKIFSFLEVDHTFVPSIIEKRVNQAGHKRNIRWLLYKGLTKVKKTLPSFSLFANLEKVKNRTRSLILGKKEYEKGMSKETKKKLSQIYTDEVEALSKKLNRDLNFWLEEDD